MSTKPKITSFREIAPLIIHQYERYLPTAFDDSLSILEKMNKIIQYLNEVGSLVNGAFQDWNNIMEWVMNDGLNEVVIDKLDKMVQDGTFDEIINVNVLGSRARIDVGTVPPPHSNNTFWFEEI